MRPFRATITRFFFLLLCACGGQAAFMPASQQPALPATGFTSPALSLPGHFLFTEFLGINDRGDVALAANEQRSTAAYVGHSPYGQKDFERVQFPGSIATTVTALNNTGLAVGYYIDAHGNVAGFTEKRGSWTHYRDLSGSTEYLGVNDAGTIVGFITDHRGRHLAFERNAKTGEITYIRPVGSLDVTATAINEAGTIVGYLTTRRGRVEGFLWKAGSATEFSYPRAIETKALGISKEGCIVGFYDEPSGKMRGFLLRSPAANARWTPFDAPKARGLTVLSGIDGRGDLVGYYRDDEGHARAFLLLGKKPPVNMPLVIPVWMSDTNGGPDPGATPDRHLFAAILTGSDSSATIAQHCPGVSSSSTCQPYKYIDLLYDQCQTAVTLAAYQWADTNDETAFQHNYPNGETSSNRITYQATPNPDCKPDSHNADMRMNPADLAFNTYLYTNVWTGKNYDEDFPSPYGAMEDQAAVLAYVVVGGGGSGEVSTEYSSGTKPSGFANQIGKSKYHALTDWETALGIFVNGACVATCLNMAINGVATGYGNVAACSVVSNGHCHGQYQSGDIDNQAAIDNICKAVIGGNLKYLQAERPIFAGRFGFEFMNSQTMTFDINTAANLYSHTSDGCATTKIVDIETSYGEGGLGDVSGGYRVRLAALAYRWLVPDPSTGIPDRVISDQLTEDGTSNEVPYFFEDTLVPYGPETTVPKYTWNGSVQTVGGGCPSANGDKGGAVALLVKCVSSAGIYCQQYQHLYIDGADYGKAAACLNTSSTTENIISSWFKHDPISSYRDELSLQGGELTSVPYQGVSGGSIALTTCTNKTYCTGRNTLSTQIAAFKGDGSDQLCGPCGVILLQNE